MEDENGELIAYANSLWTFLDIASGRPVNVDEKQIQAYTLEKSWIWTILPEKLQYL